LSRSWLGRGADAPCWPCRASNASGRSEVAIVKSAVSGEGANPPMWHQNAPLSPSGLVLLPHAELEGPHPRNCRPAGTWKLWIKLRLNEA
jgi:hypothetical protein